MPFGFWKMLSPVLFISHLTVPGSSEPFMTQGQVPNSGMQDMYNQSPSGAMSNLGMGQRQQFPYGTSYAAPEHSIIGKCHHAYFLACS